MKSGLIGEVLVDFYVCFVEPMSERIGLCWRLGLKRITSGNA